jgi:hypothetical protein
VDEDVVPDPHHEAQREAVEEEGLEPFLQPEQVWDANVLEVAVEHRELFFEDMVELIKVLL